MDVGDGREPVEGDLSLELTDNPMNRHDDAISSTEHIKIYTGDNSGRSSYFGHNVKFKWMWDDNGEPVEGERL